MRIFGSIENISGRIAAVRAAAELYFYPYWNLADVKRPLNNLLEEVRRASHIRNDIAHGRVLRHTWPVEGKDGEISHFEKMGALLIAPNYMTFRNDYDYNMTDEDRFSLFSSQYRLNTNDIITFAKKFEMLKGKIASYTSTIFKDEETGIPNVVAEIMKDFPERFASITDKPKDRARRKPL